MEVKITKKIKKTLKNILPKPFRRLRFLWSDKRFEKRMAKQRKKRGYADCDCWNMFNWFQETFPQMIRNLRDMKHGAPELEFEEVENFPLDWVSKQSEILLKQKKDKGYEEEIDLWGKEKIFDRWWLILSRIAYCLEESNEDQTTEQNEFQKEYNRQVWGDEEELEQLSFKEYWNRFWKVDKVDKKGKPLTYRLETNEPDKELQKKYYDREMEIYNYREQMKNEAFMLLNKYFFNLWD